MTAQVQMRPSVPPTSVSAHRMKAAFPPMISMAAETWTKVDSMAMPMASALMAVEPQVVATQRAARQPVATPLQATLLRVTPLQALQPVVTPLPATPQVVQPMTVAQPMTVDSVVKSHSVIPLQTAPQTRVKAAFADAQALGSAKTSVQPILTVRA